MIRQCLLAIVDTLIITRKCVHVLYNVMGMLTKVGQCVSNSCHLFVTGHNTRYTTQKHQLLKLDHSHGKGLSTHLLCTHGMELRVEHISSQW